MASDVAAAIKTAVGGAVTAVTAVLKDEAAKKTTKWERLRNLFCQISGTSSCGNAEDEMKVANRQQFLLALLKPTVARSGLTLGAVPVAAGVIRDGLVPAATAVFLTL